MIKTMTMQEVMLAFQGLAEFSQGRQRILREGPNIERIVREPWVGISGKTRMAIARNIEVLRKDAKLFEETVADLRKEATDERGMISADKEAEITKQIEEMLEAEVTRNVTIFSESAFNLDANDVSALLLESLFPVMERPSDEEPKADIALAAAAE